MEKCAIVVTGASKGNGLAISKLLAEDAQNLVIGVDIVNCDPNYEKVFERYLQIDVSSPDAGIVALKTATEITDHVCLVNNAGITRSHDLSYPLEDFDATLEVNLKAPFVWMENYRALVEQKAIKSGAIVNICSLSAHRAFPGNPAYIASKHGLIGLTKYYALVLGHSGIRVNSVSPGYVRTDMTLKSFQDEKRREKIDHHSMLGRWGESAEIAHVVRFLLIEQSSFVTGSDIPVDGGWLSKGLFLN